MTIALAFVVVLVLIPIVWVVVVYNRLVRGRVRAANGFSQIDVQLKRRCDLIPNLVEAVRGYMSHERETLEAVIAARSTTIAGLQALGASPLSAASVQLVAGASGVLDQLLARLRVSIENYPDLKASSNVMGLQEELTSTENRIAFSRQAYNDAVMRFNTDIAVFPSSLVASSLGFSALALFEAGAAERAAPEVKF